MIQMKIIIFKNLTKITGKGVLRSSIFNKVAGQRFNWQWHVFSFGFSEFFKKSNLQNTFLQLNLSSKFFNTH